MNQFFYNIATRKGKNIDRMTEQIKGAKNVAARRSSPGQSWLKVYFGKTVQIHLLWGKQTSKIFWKRLLITAFKTWFIFGSVPKHCLKRIEIDFLEKVKI